MPGYYTISLLCLCICCVLHVMAFGCKQFVKEAFVPSPLDLPSLYCSAALQCHSVTCVNCIWVVHLCAQPLNSICNGCNPKGSISLDIYPTTVAASSGQLHTPGVSTCLLCCCRFWLVIPYLELSGVHAPAAMIVLCCDDCALLWTGTLSGAGMLESVLQLSMAFFCPDSQRWGLCPVIDGTIVAQLHPEHMQKRYERVC